MKIVQSDLCTFCNSREETILHLFWDCPSVEKFWLDVIHFLKSNHFVHNDLEMNAQLIIFGGKNIPDIVNLIMLIAKRYIYSSKINHSVPHITAFKSTISRYYKVEESIAFKADKLDLFIQKWHQMKRILDIQ